MSPTHYPECTYWVGQPAKAIGPDAPLWNAGLPLTREAAQEPPEAMVAQKGAMTYGAYFTRARDWLLQNNLAILRKAARHQLEPISPAKTFQSVQIHLVKHGAFYHPAKVTVRTDRQRKVGLVLNVAVSSGGRTALKEEVANLSRLNQTFSEEFVPRVYGSRADPDRARPPVAMFAAQWLHGFYEFHLTRGPSWVLWDDRLGVRPLSADQAAATYEQAAYILTHYYNPLTFEAIGHWHHGAGDFVVRQTGEKLEVRLISVRRYAPFLEPVLESAPRTDICLESILDGICLFLLDMSLRMRLDRIDGTGSAALIPDVCIPAIWQGFKRGLEAICRQHGLPLDFSQAAQDYLAAHSMRDLICLGRRVLARYPAEAPDTALLRNALGDHIGALISVM